MEIQELYESYKNGNISYCKNEIAENCISLLDIINELEGIISDKELTAFIKSTIQS